MALTSPVISLPRIMSPTTFFGSSIFLTSSLALFISSFMLAIISSFNTKLNSTSFKPYISILFCNSFVSFFSSFRIILLKQLIVIISSFTITGTSKTLLKDGFLIIKSFNNPSIYKEISLSRTA